MAVAGLAGLLVGDGLLRVAVVALLAVVAVPAGRVVLALQADAAGNAAGELEELHVEPAPARVVVALARHALVGREGGGAAPRPVEVEGLALLTLAARGVVLALAAHLACQDNNKSESSGRLLSSGFEVETLSLNFLVNHEDEWIENRLDETWS